MNAGRVGQGCLKDTVRAMGRRWTLLACGLGLALGSVVAPVQAIARGAVPEAANTQNQLALGLIVKLKDKRTTSVVRLPASVRPSDSAQAQRLRMAAAANRKRVSYLIQKPTAFGAQVIHQGHYTTVAEAEAEAAKLRLDPDVEWVAVNQMERPASVTGQAVSLTGAYASHFWLKDRTATINGVANFTSAWTQLANRTLTPVVTADVAQVMKRRIDGGEPFDLAVLVDFQIDDLIKSGRLVAGSRTNIMSSGIGVAVKRGAPKPDISTVDALKRTLLVAKSITYLKEGASTIQIERLIRQWGMVDALEPKTTYYYQVGGGPAGKEVWSDVRTFTTATAPDASAEVRIGVSGDSRDSGRDLSMHARIVFSALACCAASMATIVSSLAHSQAYPLRPIKLIIPFAPGGPTDVVGRLIGGPKLWPAVSPKKTWSGAIGGLAGAVVAHAGVSAFKWAALGNKVLVPLVVSPLLGFIAAFLVMIGLLWAVRRLHAQMVRIGWAANQRRTGFSGLGGGIGEGDVRGESFNAAVHLVERQHPLRQLERC